MSYCRVEEAGMYIYPEDDCIRFIAMPSELGEAYIQNEHLNILLYLMSERTPDELEARISAGKQLYEKYKEKNECK